ncbi:hypothetical protein HDU81_005921 [Chytriomyces hyalinus]|nr:hypothetical protein HDU81_005921 [Chytriomyces hyalinus]
MSSKQSGLGGRASENDAESESQNPVSGSTPASASSETAAAPTVPSNAGNALEMEGSEFEGSSGDITPEDDASEEEGKEEGNQAEDSGSQDEGDDEEGDQKDADEEEEASETAAAILGSIVIPPTTGEVKQSASKNLTMDLSPSKRTSTAELRTHASRASSVAGDHMLDDVAGAIPITEETFADIQKTLRLLSEMVREESDSTDPPVPPEVALGIVKSEYEKLHKLFLQSRKNEQDLVKKCKDVSGQLMANSIKVQAALKLSQNDRATITSLKKEVKRAWNMVEAAGEKDQKNKNVIARLKIEINKMRHQAGTGDDGNGDDGDFEDDDYKADTGMNKMMGLQMEQEVMIANLKKVSFLFGFNCKSLEPIYTSQEKEFLARQNDQLLNSAAVLRSEMTELSSKLAIAQNERSVSEKNLNSVKELLSQKKTDEDRNAKSREKLESNLKAVSEALSKKEHELMSKITDLKSLKEMITKLEAIVKEEKGKLEKETIEKEKMSGRFAKLQNEFDQQLIEITHLKARNQGQYADLKTWEDELNRIKEDFRSLTRLKDGLAKKIKYLDEAKMEAEVDRDNLRGINNSLRHEQETSKKQLEAYHKEIETLSRERDIAQKNFVRATGATQKQLNTSKLAEQTKRNLEQEIQNFKDEAAKMRKIIYSLEKDRDRHINESSRLSAELDLKDEDVKIKDIMLYDCRKKITEFERKLKEQQSLYENVRADRNLYSKNLIESQDEINEMKRKLKIMTHQIEQLKEEIGNKEAALAKENAEHAKLDKDKEALSSQIDKLKQQLLDFEHTFQSQKAEENKLKRIIDQADADRVKQKKEYDIIVQERDILGTQLIRRNDELSLLYEKMKIQASTLNKGEIQYHERLEDIRVLKLEIKKLRREKAILQTETQNVEALKNEIFRLQREILREKTRVKVLEEELESPMNVHRWRKLSGSDPSTYELITKIQTLQKRLIAKTEEVLEKELVITQKEKLYREVKDVLQRQPGPEVLEELRVVKDAVKGKMRECKSLASELNMYHSQVNEYKFEIDRLTQELQELKKKYYEQKRRERDDRLKKQRYGDTAAGGGADALNPGGVVSERMILAGGYGPTVDETIRSGLSQPVLSFVMGGSNGRKGSATIRPNPNFSAKKYSGGGFNLANYPLGIQHNMASLQNPPKNDGSTRLPELHT